MLQFIVKIHLVINHRTFDKTLATEVHSGNSTAVS